MNKNLSIGFFDSGVGGLSVLARFQEKLPFENTIYFGDLKNLPYGNKTKDELICFAKNILDFFKKQGVKAVVIACNTSSALAYESIKDLYDFEIYPIIQSSAKIISQLDVSKIGVFATVGTVKSSAYKTEIAKHNPEVSVYEQACPHWVNIVETNSLASDEAKLDIKNCVSEMLQNNPDKIILGCTHYPYLISELCKYVPKENFVDPAEIFVEYIKNDLERKNLLKLNSDNVFHDFYVSANPELFVENAKLFYEIKDLPKVV